MYSCLSIGLIMGVALAATDGSKGLPDIVWDSPSSDSSGSMPLGNGDIGVNVWVEKGGDLLFYLSKTDAWSENARLLKLGRVRVSISPNPFKAGLPFTQRLDLSSGAVRVRAGAEGEQVETVVWVDANHPAVRVEVVGGKSCDVRVAFDPWRTAPRQLAEDELHSAYGLINSPGPVVVEPDTLLQDQPDRVVWFHRNERSIWTETLRIQGMEDWTTNGTDPLLHRTFGGLILGGGFKSEDAQTLISTASVYHAFSVYALTDVCDSGDQWAECITSLATDGASSDAWTAHQTWWRDFWNRSWIRVQGEEASHAARGYALQRFVSACTGRGASPIKFNGAIFTVDAVVKGKRFDADYRLWGGPYWFQNTRLCYWPMTASGDYEMMLPWFRMFREALPLAKARTNTYYGHDGAFFPETMYFWGTYANDNYGWDREGKTLGLTDNRYIRYYWQGGIELTAMMLDYFDHTQDQAFATETLLPIAAEVVTFFDQHWARDESGKIRFDPAMALETYNEAVNPVPEIAGLTHVLSRLAALDDALTTEKQRTDWRRLLSELPPLPMAHDGDATYLLPAQEYTGKQNSENVPLYAVFPYRQYAIGKPDLEIGRETYARREVKRTGGWSQDPIQAALLGLTDEAQRDVIKNFSTWDSGSRFPAFWGPNFDWTPDQDHGNVAMIALQAMLMQCDGDAIRLFPAWPEEWDVDFKLHAPHNTTVQGTLRAGKLEHLEVTPETRRNDVTIMLGEHGLR